jgi:hypothetical protein
MRKYKPIIIRPELLDQDDHLTHLASVDAHTDIIMDHAMHSALNSDQTQELAGLMEMMRTVAAPQNHEAAAETSILAVPA